VRQMLGSSPSMTLREPFQPYAKACPDAYAACPGHPNQLRALSRSPDEACACEGGGRAMTGDEATAVAVTSHCHSTVNMSPSLTWL
jgi:hypothetical protein